MTPRVRLIVAAALFVGWMSWLGFAALTKSRAPMVSRAQAAGATVPVLAELTSGEDGRKVFLLRNSVVEGQVVKELPERADRPAIVVKVKESFKGGPDADALIGIINMTECTGYTGPGLYLLLLNKDESARVENHPAYTLAGQQRSPGADFSEGGSPKIYPWTDKTGDDLGKQVKKLFP